MLHQERAVLLEGEGERASNPARKSLDAETTPRSLRAIFKLRPTQRPLKKIDYSRPGNGIRALRRKETCPKPHSEMGTELSPHPGLTAAESRQKGEPLPFGLALRGSRNQQL